MARILILERLNRRIGAAHRYVWTVAACIVVTLLAFPLHERVVLVTVSVLPIPRAAESQRISIERLSQRFFRVEIHFGFMEEPDVPAVLNQYNGNDLSFEPMQTSFFLGRETILLKVTKGMAHWRKKLFVAMFRNAGSPSAYLKLPPNRVVELGAQFVL
ncbi:MAG: KUP/HAK/KT family potassium transporter [Gammaproteobacteria bacterium]|nr:KUP/HAK/KT family potassium transporter [Gammaproteobacteria bacterium]